MFRHLLWFLFAGVAAVAAGCESSDRPKDVPTVDAFNGRLTHKGGPVKFAPHAHPQLKVITDKGMSFGIPLKEDGSFQIGWMPVGKYTVLLTTTPSGKAGKAAAGEVVYSVPGGLEIMEGQTEYSIELGDKWKD